LVIGSMDGFAALVGAEGDVQWMQYLGENVRDLDAAADGSAIWVAADTSVVCLKGDGGVIGRKDLGGAVARVRLVGTGRAIAAEGSRLVLLSPT